eukprot:1924808-Prorocentrum_lima.AAC.1
MTSSLVGSEMCIRDRQKSARLEQPVALVAGLMVVIVVATRGVAPQVQDCLLYTSDAADDM